MINSKLQFLPYTLNFANKDDYINQYKEDSKCIGTIKWPNGNCYEGEIHNNQFQEQCELTNQNNERCICKNDIICYYGTGRVASINWATGVQEFALYTIHFTSHEDFANQFKEECQCIGTIKWQNGISYECQISNCNIKSDTQFQCTKTADTGKIHIDSYGDVILYFVCFPNKGKVGQLSIDTGELNFKPYLILFEKSDDYLKQFEYTTSCFGIIQYSNGNEYKGQVHRNQVSNLYQLNNRNECGEFITQDETGLFHNGIVYLLKSGDNGKLDVEKGDIQLNQFTIQFKTTDDYKKQFLEDSQSVGTINWLNGNRCTGEIFNNLSDINNIREGGKFCNKNGENGILYKNTVCFYNSGFVGFLDKETGQLKMLPFTIHFANRDDYINQYKEDNECIGSIEWPNGNKFIGAIYYNCIQERGELYNNIGQVGLLYQRFVYFHDASIVGRIDEVTGELEILPYSIHFADKNYFFAQFNNNCNCIGTIKWSNGCSYQGNIQSNWFVTMESYTNQKGDTLMYYKQLNQQDCKYNNISTSQHILINQKTGIVNELFQNTGEVKQKIYLLNLLNKQFDEMGHIDGMIQWQNGNVFSGTINVLQLNDYLCSKGKFTTYDGESGILMNDTFNLFKSGKVGKINQQTGELTYIKYTLTFSNQDDYSKQYDEDNSCVGIIRWQNDISYEGEMYDNWFKNKTQIKSCVGENCIVFFNQSSINKSKQKENLMYFSKSGNIGVISLDTGEIDIKFTIQSVTKDDVSKLMQSDEYMCSICWLNGNKFCGIMQQLQCLEGEFTQSEEKSYLYRDNVIFYRDGKVGTLDQITGNVIFKLYTVHFSCEDDYKKYAKGQELSGTICWQSGSKYDGMILRHVPNGGVLVLKDGETYNVEQEYFRQSGKPKLTELKMKDGKIVKYDCEKGELVQ